MSVEKVEKWLATLADDRREHHIRSYELEKLETKIDKLQNQIGRALSVWGDGFQNTFNVVVGEQVVRISRNHDTDQFDIKTKTIPDCNDGPF